MPVVMRPTADLLPFILPHCAEVPAVIAEQMARFAAIEFAERSRSWRHVTSVAITSNEATPVAPPEAAIHEIEFATFDGDPLTAVQFSTFDAIPTGKPRYVSQVTPHALMVWPFTAGTMEVSVFLKPIADSEFVSSPDNPMYDRFNVVPDFFVTVHGATIALGAMQRILSIPREPWTDEAKAARYGNDFAGKLDGAFRQNMRGQQRAKIRTRYVDF